MVVQWLGGYSGGSGVATSTRDTTSCQLRKPSGIQEKGGSSVVMGINTTTSALLYKHAFMATWLEWWTVVAN